MVVQQHDIRLSMDGRDAWCANRFVEHLGKSFQNEGGYLHAYDSVPEAQHRLAAYFTFYNAGRPHSALDRRTPNRVYFGVPPQPRAA